ncbi:transposable element Tcb1 transposase [Trichonephila clavipes]|nr:transposable element Tcb1 transposase [Trichonephila clavipes]
MTSCNHMCCRSCNGSQEPFSTRQCSDSHGKGVARLSPHCYYPSLAFTNAIFVSNRAYLGSLGAADWASHEFERTRGKVTAIMERIVSRRHTELICLNAQLYIVSHRAFALEGVQQGIKSSVLFPFSLK